MVVAVTGASGHLGANLVRTLLDRGRSVRVLARSDRRALQGLEVDVVEGDLFEPAALRRLAAGAETVFHLAGRISIAGDEHGVVLRTNVDGPRAVAEACLETRVRRLVHVSSIHAFSTEPNSEMLDEGRALPQGAHETPYDRSNALGQRAVLDIVKQGLDAVVVNPTAVIGPHDWKPSRMGTVLRDISQGRLPALIDGGYNWVDARDVADALLAAERQGRTGECYLVAGRWAHFRELASIVSGISGRPAPRYCAPSWLALPVSYASLAWSRLRGVPPVLTPVAVRSVRMHRHISHGKAAGELGYRPRPLEETVRDTLRWFAEHQGI